MAASSTF